MSGKIVYRPEEPHKCFGMPGDQIIGTIWECDDCHQQWLCQTDRWEKVQWKLRAVSQSCKQCGRNFPYRVTSETLCVSCKLKKYKENS